METTYFLMNPWWEGRPFETGVRRGSYLERFALTHARPQVEILVGSRRVGKTTLLRQVIAEVLASGTLPKDVCYLALDHPALVSTPIAEHLRQFRKIQRHERARRLYLFLDEVQDSPGWEAELKALVDAENLKVFCSGSTSALLTRQGGKLTGRQITTTIHPLSFAEFLEFRGGAPSLAEDYRYETLVGEYLVTGGYPEQVRSPSPEYLKNLLDDILARDLLRLFPIKKARCLPDLMRLIAASVGSRTSFNRLAKLLGLSVDTAKEYVGYLETAFLVAPLEKWTTSHSERVYAQRKIYLGDTGFKTLLTGPGDEGSRAENAVFLELKRRGVETGYYAESEREVDFVTGPPAAPVPLEVKLLDTLDPKDKRLSGLWLFLKRYPATRRALVVSRTASVTVGFAGVEVEAVPLWRFLLDAGHYL